MTKKWLFLAGCFWFLIIVLASMVRVNKIVCFIDDKPCSNSIQNHLDELLSGKPLFFYNYEQEVAKNSHPSLIVKSIAKQFPTSILVTYSQEHTAYKVMLNQQIVSISQSGQVKTSFEPSDSENLVPLIYISQPSQELKDALTANIAIPNAFHYPLLQLVTALQEYKIEIDNIEWRSEEEIVFINQDITVFLNSQNPAGSIKAYWAIINSSSLTPEVLDNLSEIDLRFNLPVLRTR